MFPPERIVCLTAETAETLYLLGAQDRIVGISSFATRPPQAAREKARVAAFTTADIPRILALAPDLVLAFSDLQADIVAALIRDGTEIHAFNQRSIAGMLDMIATLGALVGAGERAGRLIDRLTTTLAVARDEAAALPTRPKIYFEEWDEPAICGIGWVSELIEIAGGIDIFSDRARNGAASDRIVTSDEILRGQPDAIIVSWCGKKFQPERLVTRPGFDALAAVRNDAIHEIAAPIILQPGPGIVLDGLPAMQAIVRSVAARLNR